MLIQTYNNKYIDTVNSIIVFSRLDQSGRRLVVALAVICWQWLLLHVPHRLGRIRIVELHQRKKKRELNHLKRRLCNNKCDNNGNA